MVPTTVAFGLFSARLIVSATMIGGLDVVISPAMVKLNSSENADPNYLIRFMETKKNLNKMIKV